MPGRGAEKAVVTVLSTMLADRGIGEWGFSALVEVDGRRILFDVGYYPDTVSRNARYLDIDLSSVTDVVLSHHHRDHTGGLLHLRNELKAKNPAAMSRVHVAKGMFADRRDGDEPLQSVAAQKRDFEATGGKFIVHDGVAEIFPGVWLTGPVPRPHHERNWSGGRRIAKNGEWVEDTIPESQSLVIDTDRGLVVISGCGHAGIVNTVEYAARKVRKAPIHAAIGGFHLFTASDEHLGLDRREVAWRQARKLHGRPLHRHRGGLPTAPKSWPGPRDRSRLLGRLALRPGRGDPPGQARSIAWASRSRFFGTIQRRAAAEWKIRERTTSPSLTGWVHTTWQLAPPFIDENRIVLAHPKRRVADEAIGGKRLVAHRLVGAAAGAAAVTAGIATRPLPPRFSVHTTCVAPVLRSRAMVGVM